MNKLLMISMFAKVLLIAHLAMAQPVVTGALFTRRVLVKDDRAFLSITWYLNATDSYYYIKGLAKNTLSEDRDGIKYQSISTTAPQELIYIDVIYIDKYK
jgi:hypothetical protein